METGTEKIKLTSREGSIASEWGTSEANRRAAFYRLTRVGRLQLGARFFTI
jgi:hypothetical protein